MTDAVEAVRGHPRLAGIATGVDHTRLADLAVDLARWYVGGRLEEAGPALRVVAALAGSRLEDPRRLCRDRPALACEAAAEAAAALWPWLTTLDPPPEEPPPPSGSGGAEGDDATPDSQQGEDRPPTDLLEAAIAAAEERAVDTARLLRRLEALAPGIGTDLAPGVLERVATADLHRLAALIAAEPALAVLVDRVGRVEAAAAREGGTRGGGEEVVGVQLGGALERALPSDLGLLGDDDTEWMVLQRMAERRLVEVALAGAGAGGTGRPERRGPIVVVLDTSGSMQGPPEHAARALVLALARRAARQRRPLTVYAFGGPGQIRSWTLGPSRPADLLEFLAWAWHGGTDLEGPLRVALDHPGRDADLLLVTDGYVTLSDQAREALSRARGATRIFTVLVGRIVPSWAGPLSHEVWTIPPDKPELLSPRLR